MLAFVGGFHRYAPAELFGVTLIHAEEITRKNRRFITTRSRAHFEIDVAIVSGILGHEFRKQRRFDFFETLFRRSDFFRSEFRKLRIIQHAARRFEIRQSSGLRS